MARPDGASDDERRLRESVDRQARRMARAERERRSVLVQIGHVGVLGLLLVLPMVAGAYLGSWLDERLPGYAIHWTLTLLLAGLMIGIVNVYLFLRELP